MRCRACDKILEETELTKKDSNGDFLDLCSTCVSASSLGGLDTENATYYQYEVFTDEDDCDTLY
jgi:hypothetical protein